MLTSANTFIFSRIIKLRALSFFKVLFVSFLINTAFSFDVSAQRDVIITQAKEEIRCRILDETPTRFVYAYVGPKGNILRNEIFKNLVSDFRYNKYDSDLPITQTKKGKSKKNKKSKNIALASKDATSTESSKKELAMEQNNSEEKEVPKAEAPKESQEVKKKVRKEKKTKEKVEETGDKVEDELLVDAKVSEKPEKTKKELRKEKKAIEKKERLEAVNSKDSDDKVEEELLVEAEVPEKPEKTKKELRKEQKAIEEETKEALTKSEDTLIEVKQPIDQELVKDIEEEVEIEEKPALKVEKPILAEKSLPETSSKSTPIVGESALETTGEFKNYLKWRVGVKAGIGNILDNSFEASNAYGLYQEKLLKGWTFGADLAFFPLEGFGLGLVYTDFKSSNSNDNLTYFNQASGEEITGSISNKISRKFIGPTFFLRKGIDFKTFVVLGVGPGMYFYSDKGDYNQANFEYTGKEFGGAATLGLDFLLGNDIIGRDIILSLEAGYNMGRINDLNYGDGTGIVTLDNPIIMDRLDFSIGLRFMRFPKYLKK